MAETNDTAERWLPVAGYEGIYSVSDMGRVRSERSGSNTFPGKVLACPVDTHDFYRAVALVGAGKQRKRTVHSLVMAAFAGPCPVGWQVNHIDGDKLNNRLSNLEYVTPGENTRHAIRTGLRDFTGANHWSTRHPERVPRGDANGARKHPESLHRGASHWSARMPERRLRGTSVPNAKLTDEVVRQIRALGLTSMKQRDIAALFGTNQACVWRIIHRKAWAHVI